MKLQLSDIEGISGIKVVNPEAAAKRFSGVSIDSRKCGKNDLFFAIKGEKFDGHDFLNDVFTRGTKCAVVNEK